jgi:energy-coupling factor transport system substrate-specific component
VSWTLASLVILLAALAACGWWYERTRPSAKVVAVVATLAALAALGRDAFVALPDVKPITAMAFVSGYALGAGPGFAIGAVGMLASNIALGQGPYTPWQMVAWGLVGVLGAALGALTRRRLGRVPLALACGVAAFIAKEIMNVYTWTLGASHTPAAFLAIAGTALPFDVTDVVASILFGFAFGPELAHLLARTRARMDVRWEPVVGVLLALTLAGGLASAPSAQAAQPGVAGAAHYLQSVQNSDGGFGAAPGQGSSEEYTGWAAMGLAAAGVDPADVSRDGHSVLSALRAGAGTLDGTGDQERTMLALYACGASVSSDGRVALLAPLLRAREGNGSFSGQVNLTSFAIFALRAAGRRTSDADVRGAARWLVGEHDGDGGYNFAGAGGSSDIDDTAGTIQALVDAGERGAAVVTRAVAWLRGQQNSDGGFPLQPGSSSNAQSTAWAIQAFVAAGVPLTSVTRHHSVDPIRFLLGLQQSNGSVRYSATSSQSPVWVTAQALTALALAPMPIAVPRHAAHARVAARRKSPNGRETPGS